MKYRTRMERAESEQNRSLQSAAFHLQGESDSHIFSGRNSTGPFGSSVNYMPWEDPSLTSRRFRRWPTAPIGQTTQRNHFTDCEVLHSDPIRQGTTNNVQGPAARASPLMHTQRQYLS
jgi:hypothetical protein